MLVKKKKIKMLDISGKQLFAIMKKAAETATEEIEFGIVMYSEYEEILKKM